MVIYFDLDDTLYRLYDPFYKAYQKVFHEDLDIYALWKQSRIYSNEIYPKYLNKLITSIEVGNGTYPNKYIRYDKYFHQFITNQQALDFQKVYENQQAHLTLSYTMKELFNYLKEKNISYGIITNGKEKTQMTKINSLFPIIDFPIIISEKVGYQKPQKEIFELIQENDSYYVGDGYEIDMMGAHQAGLKTIWYNHQKQEKDTSFIDFVVYSDEELLEVVKKLNND